MPRILVVDDDPETCRFMNELLREPDREIEMAESPEHALARIAERRIDLVVSDINLNADQDGLDLLRAFKAIDPDVEVVLISAFGTLETALAAGQGGAFDYVSKPVDIAQVREVVGRALARRARAAEPRAPVFPVGHAAPDGLVGRSGAMLAGLQADRARLRLRRAGAGDGRDRHRQGAGSARDPPERRARGAAVRARSTAARCRRGCSSRSCSATCAAPSPAPVVDKRGPVRGGARRHAVPRRDRRDVEGAAGAAAAGARDRARCAPSARRAPPPSTRGSSRRRTATSSARRATAASARTCSTGCTCS
jgi:DNA-binding response OmpR family regulator